jgi:hypothetical protein
MTNDTPPVAPVEGSYTLMPTKLAEVLTALVPLAAAVLDHADAHCRAFPIATAPASGEFEVWSEKYNWWDRMIRTDGYEMWSGYTHWRTKSPPPSNPPLPAVFTELGQALEKIKGAQNV